MGATLTTLNAITKEIYEPGIREQLNNEVPMLRRIERTSRGTSNEVGGRYVTFPIHVSRNQGIGARNELEALPVAGQQGFNAARIGLKYLYGSVQLSGQTIALIDKNYQAFASGMDQEMSGIRKDLAIDQNRQVWGNGTGAIGTSLIAQGPLNTVVLDRVDLFQINESVDFVLANGTVSQAARTVTAINTATKAITISGGTITMAIGDYFVRNGNVNREWTGLSAIVGSGLLYNINSSAEPSWQSVNVVQGSPTAVSEGQWTKEIDDIRINGGETTVIVTSLGVRRAYANLLTSQRQFVNVKEFKGGFSGIGFVTDTGEVPVIADYMAPPNTVWFLNEKALKVYREDDWGFMDMDGSKWQRVIGFDAYSATLFQYSELGTDRRNTHGKITNVIEE